MGREGFDPPRQCVEQIQSHEQRREPEGNPPAGASAGRSLPFHPSFHASAEAGPVRTGPSIRSNPRFPSSPPIQSPLPCGRRNDVPTDTTTASSVTHARQHARLPELLAPAGDWECAKAAVENGADAVYFGLTRFNARLRANNFSEVRSAQVDAVAPLPRGQRLRDLQHPGVHPGTRPRPLITSGPSSPPESMPPSSRTSASAA
jgi:hypothetical protein